MSHSKNQGKSPDHQIRHPVRSRHTRRIKEGKIWSCSMHPLITSVPLYQRPTSRLRRRRTTTRCSRRHIYLSRRTTTARSFRRLWDLVLELFIVGALRFALRLLPVTVPVFATLPSILVGVSVGFLVSLHVGRRLGGLPNH